MARHYSKRKVRNGIDRLWWLPMAVALAGLIGYLVLLQKGQHACTASVGCTVLSAFLHTSMTRFLVVGFALVMSAVSVAKFYANGERSRLLAKQHEIADLRNMDWQAFERLVGEAYRRSGFVVTENGQGGADGGVDLILKKGNRTSIVQVKHWKASKVGAPVVRELFGLMHHFKAQEARIVAVGSFTSEAWAFAKGKPIDLVTGEKLFALIQSAKSGPQ